MAIRSADGGTLEDFSGQAVVNNVPITEIELSIATGADDGYAVTYWSFFSAVALTGVTGWNSASGMWTHFFRFVNDSLEQGVGIATAKIKFTCSQNHLGTPTGYSCNLYGVLEDDPPAPVSAAEVAALSKTAAVAWVQTEDWELDEEHYSADITAILQEIVNRPGFTKNNHIILVLENPGGAQNQFNYFYFYDEDAAKSPKIEITLS